MISSKILPIFSLLFVMACVEPTQSAIATSGSDAELPVHYTTGEPWMTRIDFYPRQLVYSRAKSSEAARNASDAGRSIQFSEDAHSYYVEDLPFSVPKERVASWKTDAFSCRATESGMGILIKCTSTSSGRQFNSFYDDDRGIRWFDYACGPYTGEICRYELNSPLGLFSARMLSAFKK